MKHLLILAGLLILQQSQQILRADVVQAPGALWQYQQDVNPAVADPSWMTSTAIPLSGSGLAPFGNTGGGDFGANTTWDVNTHLYVRRTLDLSGYDLSTVTYDLGVDNGFDLYVNGNHVAGDNAEGFTFRWEYTGLIPAADLVGGNNIIALVLEDHGGLTAFDMQISARPLATAPDAASTISLMGLGIAALGAVRRKLR